LSGLIQKDQLTEQVSINLPESNVETIGGFIAEQLGRIPQKGDFWSFKEYHFEVTKVSQNRVLEIDLTKERKQT